MKRLTSLIFLIIWVPFLVAVGWGYLGFKDLPWLGSPPDWSDGLNLLTTIAAFISVLFFYLQIRDQREKDELARLNIQLDGIPSLIESIRFGNQVGTEAIVNYGLQYDYKMTPHPRVVIDKIQYAITQLRIVLIDLTKINDHKSAIRTAQKCCLLFYSHLYFTVGHHDKLGKGLISSIEPPYLPFKKQFEDMQEVTYALLIHWNLVGQHAESEVKRPVKNVVETETLAVYNYFKRVPIISTGSKH
jgi:hypothetical protein